MFLGTVEDAQDGTNSDGSLSFVRQASLEIMTSIRRQLSCEPVSMGEYIQSPQEQISSSDRSASDGKNMQKIERNASSMKNFTERDWLLHNNGQTASQSESDGVRSSQISTKASFQQHVGTSTVVGSVFTLTNTILGSGTLTVPFAIASSGWLLGNIVMFIIACITRYSVHLLLLSSDLAGRKTARTYESLGHYTMGRFGTFLAEFTFIFGGFGTLISYMIFISALIANVFGIAPDQKWMVSITCFLVVIFPLSLYRKIAKLRVSSLAAIISITYVVLFVFCAFLYKQYRITHSKPVDIKAVIIDPGSVYTVTLLIAAFACHNTALPVYEELRSRSLNRMDRAVCYAILIAFVLYEIIGLFGYLQFGTETMDNILLNFSSAHIDAHCPAMRIPILIGQTCMAVALLLSVPVAMWPFRSCLLSVYLRWRNNGQQTPSHKATRIEYIVVTICSQSLIVFCSIVVPSVKVALSIVGSVSGSLLIFIMPSLFYLLQTCSTLKDVRKHWGPLIMLLAGIMVGALGLSLTVYKIVQDH
uniref:Amino Acid/Auxin Permease (AAAP) Family putative n=1 Tax=Albugo laibachii Nc14 TaxID=890382 RepID=F0WBJ4_9STRA|nr:Amino Acid/Auxin Permease (AAAP) Family putative [Albugo laibachii Nc14]|eukprot:CCA18521.1 Amino Acid/Auxin Permease (AAAP) Family putative [Albugo laibachii Nc14]